ncbi:vWA domain-containing protein [Paracoccus tegillarcae]|uniref:VWA domain-containing protein n=1 Tax=Paracoccus tegillarcae TaxID=1529068 RepID=A0A2K9EIB2_9RHOB|nr:VWA domain-containing protein [Paracoccus tegillarcae]AUH34710.1 VWA domain-containing protein [Paracoccus tegillarcae]
MAGGQTRSAPQGRLAENIVHFARALRKAGVKLGTAQVETAIRAVEVAGFTRRADFYYILRATMITRADDLTIFHQVFAMFWRDPEFIESLLHLLSHKTRDDKPPAPKPAAHRRAADAMGEMPDREPPDLPEREEVEQEALLSWSDNAVLRRMDFEQMSAAELTEAEAAIRRLTLPVSPKLTRRMHPEPHGAKPDPRATLRASLRRGGEIGRIARKSRLRRPPDLVAICDISGSMSVYSRLLMRFLHALAHNPQRQWGRVSAFTFGTQLTNVTRALRQRDPDEALAAIGSEADDWQGGTRIGDAIERFNKDWSRRVLGSDAVVLLITDGLERGDAAHLASQMQRLSLSARRLIWLNPLLRYDGFAPRAGGVRAILPHVHSLHACHSLDSLGALSDALAEPGLRDTLLRQL